MLGDVVSDFIDEVLEALALGLEPATHGPLMHGEEVGSPPCRAALTQQEGPQRAAQLTAQGLVVPMFERADLNFEDVPEPGVRAGHELIQPACRKHQCGIFDIASYRNLKT